MITMSAYCLRITLCIPQESLRVEVQTVTTPHSTLPESISVPLMIGKTSVVETCLFHSRDNFKHTATIDKDVSLSSLNNTVDFT